LNEPLSEHELEVLRLLATDLDGPEIASQLMVSLNTMRTHTKSIYTKLGVNSRRAAVQLCPGAPAAVADRGALNHHINHHMR
jgi:ATP/maltotriose-dependent transcriptional regulator MalT